MKLVIRTGSYEQVMTKLGPVNKWRVRGGNATVAVFATLAVQKIVTTAKYFMYSFHGDIGSPYNTYPQITCFS